MAGGGLYLQVAPADGGVTKAWLFRFQRNGHARAMGLGQARVGKMGTVTLARARELAQAAREQLVDGIDPIDAKRTKILAERAEAAKAWTFKEAAEGYIADHRKGWKNKKHAAQVAATLETYAYPVFGRLDVRAIDTELVLKAIKPIWTTKTETASRVRSRIESVLGYAKAHKRRYGDNPARWTGNLKEMLPAKTKVREVRHHPALPYAEIGAFMAELRQREATTARCLEFVILTACRTGEALNARRGEFDLKNKLWTVPASRTKSGREHRVPLSDRAVEILEGLPEEEGSGYVFMGDIKGRPPSHTALLMLMRRMGRGDLTVHGFRSTFRDWAAECTRTRCSRWRWRTRSATRPRPLIAAAISSRSAAA